MPTPWQTLTALPTSDQERGTKYEHGRWYS
jgi:hypothetical protein